MSTVPPVPAVATPTTTVGAQSHSGLYASADEALKKVSSEYEYWSGKLTDFAPQMCYAVIGADWVIFGSVNGILAHRSAKYSLVLVILALASNVIGAWILSGLLRRRVFYGEGNPSRWDAEYRDALGKRVPYPFTATIDKVGAIMRWTKSLLTLAGGVLLIIGAMRKH